MPNSGTNQWGAFTTPADGDTTPTYAPTATPTKPSTPPQSPSGSVTGEVEHLGISRMVNSPRRSTPATWLALPTMALHLAVAMNRHQR